MKTFPVIGVVVVVIIALLSNPAESFTSGIHSVVYTLADYQTENGGFRLTKDAEPSLEATEHALFLSSLFGLRDKINSGKVGNFIQTLNNPDHGYSNQPGKQSDLESVRYAILSLSHLATRVTNPSGVAAFIQSLYDSDTKLFANTFGGSGDIKSTAIAFQCFSLLNILQTSEVTEKAMAIKNHFDSLVKGDAFTKYFSSLTSDNYYSIVVASYVGFEFGDLRLWARYFVERQVKDGTYMGGFFSDQTNKELSSEDASHALSALDILQRLSPIHVTFTDHINTANLIRYANTLPRSLRAAAASFTAIARTSAFQSTFKITTHYDVLDPRYRPVGDRFIQGTQLKPVLNVRTHYGLAHAGLDVSVTITHKSTGEKTIRKLTWNADSQTYVSDEFYNTSDKLGELSVDYVIRWLVVDLGNELSIAINERKSIGYDLSIRSKAAHAGRDVDPHGVVGVGTEFTFHLQLGTLKQPKPTLLYGDFKVTFSVLDASFVVVYRTQYTPPTTNTNAKAIHFNYVLDNTDIPGGDLTFHFTVSNSEGTHTNDSLSYVLPLTMVATQIQFEGFESTDTANYRIGDTVVVKMQPGSLPDLRTVQYYKSKDYLGKEVDRNFFMDVSSSETQAILFSLPGNPTTVDNTIAYTFRLPVAATFDAIGNNVVSFRYETAKGKSIVLQNYDSKQGELFEDGKHLTYAVKTELHLVNLKDAPKDGELQYGNEIKFNFQVTDQISNKLVFAGAEKSTAYLVLKHKEENRALPFTSNKQKAVEITKQGVPVHFSIAWSINPNAVMGDGYLELVAQGADGKEIPIFEEKSQKQWRVNVKIGGTITVQDNKFSSEINEEDTVFLVEFDLSCKEAKLSDARLKAVVRYLSGKTKETVVHLPVSQSRQGGRYEISWLQPTEIVKSGEYVVDFYREVDRKRVMESTNSEEDVESKLEPLFSISFYHQGGALSKFPLKLEVVSMMVLGGGFFWMVWQKMEIEGTRKNKKNKK